MVCCPNAKEVPGKEKRNARKGKGRAAEKRGKRREMERKKKDNWECPEKGYFGLPWDRVVKGQSKKSSHPPKKAKKNILCPDEK